MYEFSVTSILLVAIAAFLLSLFFDYFPGVAKKFDLLEAGVKQMIISALLLLIAAVVFVGGCYSIFITGIACTINGVIVLFGYFIEAVMVNQPTHQLTKPSAALKARMFGVQKGRR